MRDGFHVPETVTESVGGDVPSNPTPTREEVIEWITLENRAALEAADLRGLDLSHADLWGGDLHGLDWTGTSFESSNLFGADFSGANLCGCNLKSANIGRTNFRGARYDDETVFPIPFDPKRAGMVNASEVEDDEDGEDA